MRSSRRPASCSSALRSSLRLPRQRHLTLAQHTSRAFHGSAFRAVVKPYLLADIGEGITECQIIQWFVQPGARVAQFDKICEVQSDKAAVEITSRFDGVIRRLYYEADEVAKVGKPLVDIDVEGEDASKSEGAGGEGSQRPDELENRRGEEGRGALASKGEETVETKSTQERVLGRHAMLATPAVRHLTKELGIDIADVPGTGKDGRVLKEDVQRHAATPRSPSPASSAASPRHPSEDKAIPLTGIRKAMYQTMTSSLSIPHFLYTDSVDLTSLNRLRSRLNSVTSSSSPEASVPPRKLSALPFIMKALSLSLTAHPSLNAHLSHPSPGTPLLTQRAAHHIGFAVDTPHGLLVPVVKNVQSHTILSLSDELHRLASLARANRLAAPDVSDATISVSNIGALGAGVVAPVVVAPQVAILAVGRVRSVPAFGEAGQLLAREEAVFSWSADHRVVDGASLARCAEALRGYLEGAERMLVAMR